MPRPHPSHRGLLPGTLRALGASLVLVLAGCASGAPAPQEAPGAPAGPPSPLAFTGTWSGTVMMEFETAHDPADRGARSTNETTMVRRFHVLTLGKEGEGLGGTLTDVPDEHSLRETHWLKMPLTQTGVDGRKMLFTFLPHSRECGLAIELSDDRSVLKGSYRCRTKDVPRTVVSQTVRSHFELRRGN